MKRMLYTVRSFAIYNAQPAISSILYIYACIISQCQQYLMRLHVYRMCEGLFHG